MPVQRAPQRCLGSSGGAPARTCGLALNIWIIAGCAVGSHEQVSLAFLVTRLLTVTWDLTHVLASDLYCGHHYQAPREGASQPGGSQHPTYGLSLPHSSPAPCRSTAEPAPSPPTPAAPSSTRPTALRPNPGNRHTEQPRQWPGGLWTLLSLSGPSGPTAMFQTAFWGPAALLEDTSSGCPCGTPSPRKPLLGWCQPVWSRPWVSIPAHSVLALTGRSHCPDGQGWSSLAWARRWDPRGFRGPHPKRFTCQPPFFSTSSLPV